MTISKRLVRQEAKAAIETAFLGGFRRQRDTVDRRASREPSEAEKNEPKRRKDDEP